MESKLTRISLETAQMLEEYRDDDPRDPSLRLLVDEAVIEYVTDDDDEEVN